jgi:bifunctional UDP-N-acetylglucosamine pyrophosphorylase/glucosamine-1-phosphate N-acetyltransferase
MAAQEGKRIQSAQPESAIEVEGINNRMQLSKLERALQMRQAEHLMMEGVTLLDPNRFDLRGELIVGKDVVIDVNVVIEGRVVLGDGVVIGPNCCLKNCEVQANSKIEAFSQLDNALVGENCTVGPYGRLRPGSELKAHAKVGNFVEMKNAVLGEGAKANHLTYLGDAEVGAQANIGAGTITCNYDGVNKSKTVIGENAFIGSNSALVAPVTIGKDATVGAGSTINKDVNDNELALSRAKQRNIEGWQRPSKR